jgi:HAD superfamily hydrolase (TIGR01509 family)
MALQAVLFDLDGTLIDSERDNAESVVRAARRFGAALDESDRAFVVGHSWNEIHARLVQRHDLEVPLDRIIAVAVEEKRTIQAGRGAPELPAARATVERLARRARLAVVSGASRVEVQESVEALGLRAAFALLLGAEDYGRGKPDPEPYRLAMQRLGVEPGGCVVIEDASAGVQSGRAAGARVVGVRAGNWSGADLSAAHVVIDTLADLTDELVDRLTAGLEGHA